MYRLAYSATIYIAHLISQDVIQFTKFGGGTKKNQLGEKNLMGAMGQKDILTCRKEGYINNMELLRSRVCRLIFCF